MKSVIFAMALLPLSILCMEPKPTIQKYKHKNLLIHKLFKNARKGDVENLAKALKPCTVRANCIAHRMRSGISRMSLLHIAAQQGHKKVAQYLIEELKMNPQHTNRLGQSALYLASAQGHKSVVRYLMKKAKVPWRTKNIQVSPVSIAIQNNHQPVVRRLLKHQECIICLDHMSKVPLNDIVITSCCQQIMCKQMYAQLEKCPGCRKQI